MSLSLEALRALFKERNVEPFSYCVRSGEHSKSVAFSDRAYYTIFGGELINDLSRHPRIARLSPWGWTSAAGAYQAMCAVTGKVETDTWGDFCRAMGETADTMPFDRDTQDCFYVWCLRRRHALDDVIRGDLDAAMLKCSYEWASLPPGRYGQPTTTMDKLRAVFIDRGGLLATDNLIQPAAPIEERDLSGIPPVALTEVTPSGGRIPAPIEERDLSGIPPRVEQEASMPEESPSFDWSALAKVGGAIASIFNPAVGIAISALSPLLQEKITKTVGKHSSDPKVAAQIGAQLTEAVMTTAKTLTGKVDDLEAVAIMRKDPAMIAAVERAVTNKLDELAPFLDKLHQISKEEWEATAADRAAAAERAKNDQFDMAGPLLYASIGGVGFITVFVAAVILIQIVQGKPVGTELWAALTGLIGWITAKAGTIYDYRFGTSRQSAAKDVLIGELSRR